MELALLPSHLNHRTVVLVHSLHSSYISPCPRSRGRGLETHSMIMSRLNLVLPPQLIRRILTLLLTRAIDDPTLTLVTFLDERRNIEEDSLGLGSDFVLEVRTIERLREHERVGHAEVLDDVRLNSVVRSRGEGDYWDPGVVLLERSHLFVVRTWSASSSVEALERDERDVRKS